MLNDAIRGILLSAKQTGWVMEPNAKRLLKASGISVPDFTWATTREEALSFANKIGYPVVAKIVSPKVLHKSDVNGVVVGIEDEGSLKRVYKRFSTFEDFSGVLVEEMVLGVELIIGAKMDYQFGVVILLGIGGTGVEVYQDTTLRMAPLEEKDVQAMIKGLKGRRLLEGYRGRSSVNIKALTRTLLNFSHLAMDLSDEIDSADLNPVMCSPNACIVADARIILRKGD